jgi:hypothetical protein
MTPQAGSRPCTRRRQTRRPCREPTVHAIHAAVSEFRPLRHGPRQAVAELPVGLAVGVRHSILHEPPTEPCGQPGGHVLSAGARSHGTGPASRRNQGRRREQVCRALLGAVAPPSAMSARASSAARPSGRRRAWLPVGGEVFVGGADGDHVDEALEDPDRPPAAADVIEPAVGPAVGLVVGLAVGPVIGLRSVLVDTLFHRVRAIASWRRVCEEESLPNSGSAG